MMDEFSQNRLKTALEDRLKTLVDADKIASTSRATVQLDQQSVGRLSRMDAMQQQAMANATHRRREQEIHRIKLAFRRIEDGEFGYCADCGDEIPTGRLELDPTVARCITCIRG